MGAVPGWPAAGESESPRAAAGDQSHGHWSHSAGLLSWCNALSRHGFVPRSSHHPIIKCEGLRKSLWSILSFVSIDQLLIAHIASFPGLPTVQFFGAFAVLSQAFPLFHDHRTVRDQRLDGGKAWERGSGLPMTLYCSCVGIYVLVSVPDQNQPQHRSLSVLRIYWR